MWQWAQCLPPSQNTTVRGNPRSFPQDKPELSRLPVLSTEGERATAVFAAKHNGCAAWSQQHCHFLLGLSAADCRRFNPSADRNRAVRSPSATLGVLWTECAMRSTLHHIICCQDRNHCALLRYSVSLERPEAHKDHPQFKLFCKQTPWIRPSMHLKPANTKMAELPLS